MDLGSDSKSTISRGNGRLRFAGDGMELARAISEDEPNSTISGFRDAALCARGGGEDGVRVFLLGKGASEVSCDMESDARADSTSWTSPEFGATSWIFLDLFGFVARLRFVVAREKEAVPAATES